MSKLFITWHSILDNRTCEVCRKLDGYTWTFDAGKGDVLGDGLHHPDFGLVWSLSMGSKAHGHERFNCRCHITSAFDLEDVRAKCQRLKEMIIAKVEAETP